MIDYQKVMYMRGTMLGLLMLIGLGGIIRSWRGGGLRRRRNWGGPALFPWVAALAMEIVPPATADFSLRYVVATIPVICMTAALAFARPLPESSAPPVVAGPARGQPFRCSRRRATMRALSRPGTPHRDGLIALRYEVLAGRWPPVRLESSVL